MPAINIEIPDELHRALKVRAAETGLPMTQLVPELLQTGLSSGLVSIASQDEADRLHAAVREAYPSVPAVRRAVEATVKAAPSRGFNPEDYPGEPERMTDEEEEKMFGAMDDRSAVARAIRPVPKPGATKKK